MHIYSQMKDIRAELNLCRKQKHDMIIYLMFDGLVQHEQRFSGTLVEKLVQKECEPGAQHLLGHTLRSPEEQLGVALTLHALLYEVGQEGLENVCAVLHPALQSHHDKAGHVHSVSH